MKKFLLALVALFFVGCASRVFFAPDNRVILSGFDSQIIQSINSRINQNGILEIELVLYSAHDKDFDYKVVWYDADGFALQDPMSSQFQRARINKKQELILKKVAFDKRAKNYKIHINGV